MHSGGPLGRPLNLPLGEGGSAKPRRMRDKMEK